MPETKGVVKAVRLDLSPDEHKRLRIEAAKAGMSMSAFVRSLVIERINEPETKSPSPLTPKRP